MNDQYCIFTVVHDYDWVYQCKGSVVFSQALMCNVCLFVACLMLYFDNAIDSFVL